MVDLRKLVEERAHRRFISGVDGGGTNPSARLGPRRVQPFARTGPVTVTLAPSAWAALAVAKPIPELPPITMTVFCARDIFTASPANDTLEVPAGQLISES